MKPYSYIDKKTLEQIIDLSNVNIYCAILYATLNLHPHQYTLTVDGKQIELRYPDKTLSIQVNPNICGYRSPSIDLILKVASNIDDIPDTTLFRYIILDSIGSKYPLVTTTANLPDKFFTHSGMVLWSIDGGHTYTILSYKTHTISSTENSDFDPYNKEPRLPVATISI